MANEITVQNTLKLANGKDKYAGDATQYSVTQTTTRPANLLGVGSVNVSTDAAVTIPGVAAANYGWTQFFNLDSTTTNYIEVGPVSGGVIIPCFRIYGGGPPATMQLVPSVTYRAQASTGTQVMLMVAVAK